MLCDARISWCVAVAVALFGQVVFGQLLYEEVGAKRGIGPQHHEDGWGSGIAAADFDDDGYVDVFVPQAAGFPNQLYHNLGDGAFEEIAAEMGLASMHSSRTALWIDYDGDGNLDLFVANDDKEADTSFQLFRQEPGGWFCEVTNQAGVFKTPIVMVSTHHWGGICAGDINNDGHLDIFTVQYRGPGHLFLNNGDGTFEDISESSGVASQPFFMHQTIMGDFNQDGWMDMYVAVDFDANILWINQHDNTFVNMAALAGMDNAMNDMGLALGDYDNDGDFDVYVTNIYLDEDHPNGPRFNLLLRNESVDGFSSFTNVSLDLAVDNGGFGWGATFIDGDNNGDLDIATTNGRGGGSWEDDVSRFFLNVDAGDSPFVDVSEQVQFDDTMLGSALIAFDFDRDGDLDLMQVVYDGPLRLLENRLMEGGQGDRNYLVIKPRTNEPNHRAIGAVVRIAVGETNMMRVITAGTSYLGQEPAEAFFGLGGASVVENVKVDWPDGTHTNLYDVAVNQILTLHQPGGDCDDDGDVDLMDLSAFMQCITGPDEPFAAGCGCSDFDYDGDVDLLDWGGFQAMFAESK